MVELDSVVFDLARDYFDFRENEKLKVFSTSRLFAFTSIPLRLCSDGEISVSGRHYSL